MNQLLQHPAGLTASDARLVRKAVASSANHRERSRHNDPLTRLSPALGDSLARAAAARFFQIILAFAAGGFAQLADMLAAATERVRINRRAGEITISFGGDTNQAAQFTRRVPDFVLKGGFADLVKLDMQALEEDMGCELETMRPEWRRVIRR